MSQEERVRSRWWYLLPIFFQIIGGVIAYFILRNDDPKKAKNCLWLGIVLTAIKIGFFVIFISLCTSIGACADFHDEFMSGMNQGMIGSGMMNQGMNTMMSDSDQIQMMEGMMADMMERMQADPELKQAMMEHMERMQQMNP